VADQILQQFAENFALRVTTLAAAGPAGAAPQMCAAPAPTPSSLNALSLLWGSIRAYLRGLFQRPGSRPGE
jgi:hypothetical protein